MKAPDWNRTAEDYARHRAGFPDWFYERVAAHGLAELRDLILADYGARESFSVDDDISYSPEAWRGRIRASAGVSASLGAAEVEEFDTELAAMLVADFPGAVIQVPHRIVAVWGQKKSTVQS